jgi:CRP/FNR family cyclic AMP-dependent transcriptional regulator
VADLEILRKVPLFADLDATHLQSILKVTEVKSAPKNSVLFSQGDRGDSLYLILSGRVKALLYAEDGRELILAVLGPGEIVGEMALFDLEEQRSATVVAAEDSEFLHLSGQQFKNVLNENPAIAFSVIRTLSQRLKDTSSRIANLIFLDTYSRVGRYLLDLAKRQGKRLADGSVLVTRPPQHEIAHYIGSSRETVSRALNDLEKQGLIRLAGRKILLYRLKK